MWFPSSLYQLLIQGIARNFCSNSHNFLFRGTLFPFIDLLSMVSYKLKLCWLQIPFLYFALMMGKLSQKLLETHPFKLKSNIETGLSILLLLVIFLVPDLGSLHFSVIALRSFSLVLKFAYLLTLNILSFASFIFERSGRKTNISRWLCSLNTSSQVDIV